MYYQNLVRGSLPGRGPLRGACLALAVAQAASGATAAAQPSPRARIQGFGTETAGGLSGAVFRVTSLLGEGPGSLREAVDARGPRLVVFEVGGVIDLEGRSLLVREPDLTIAGQTAPDPGITLIGGSLVVMTHDVVIQHLAVRPGDRGQPARSGWEPDGLSTSRGASGPVHHVVFDHCSATWAVDENLSVSGPADVDAEATSHDVTLWRCLIAEGLSHSSHGKGEHSKGTLVHDGVRNVAIVGCLYAHNRERNPRLKGGTRAAVVNNVIYDWGDAAVGMGAHGNARTLTGAAAALVGNFALAGPSSGRRAFVHGLDPGGRAYLQGNVVLDAQGRPAPESEGVELLSAPPLWPDGLVAREAWAAAAAVLREAGARAARRDAIDARIVGTVIEGTGSIIDSQAQVGGYPVRPATRRALRAPDGLAARREWLDRLSAEIDTARGLGLAPLLRRLGRGR